MTDFRFSFVNIESQPAVSPSSNTQQLQSMHVENTMDDTVLPETAFSEPVTEGRANLEVIDQCIILASCLAFQASSARHKYEYLYKSSS